HDPPAAAPATARRARGTAARGCLRPRARRRGRHGAGDLGRGSGVRDGVAGERILPSPVPRRRVDRRRTGRARRRGPGAPPARAPGDRRPRGGRAGARAPPPLSRSADSRTAASDRAGSVWYDRTRMARYPSSGVTYAIGPGGMSPAVKLLLIVNVAMFLATLVVPEIRQHLGLRPQAVVERGHIWQLVTYAFLHADVFHILFNMLALWMFGVEL